MLALLKGMYKGAWLASSGSFPNGVESAAMSSALTYDIALTAILKDHIRPQAASAHHSDAREAANARLRLPAERSLAVPQRRTYEKEMSVR